MLLYVATLPAWCADETKPARIPFKAASTADDTLVYRALAGFLIAAAAAYGLAWCIRRYLPALGKSLGKERELERLETMRLTPRSTLVRVRYGNEELLLGEGEHGVTLITKRPSATGIAKEHTDANA